MICRLRLALSMFFLSACVRAGPAPFDLAGPVMEARVTRHESSLPIAEVPNLAAGDRLWIKADLPPNQSSHYLLVVAFLSGATNPPPENWFYPCKTWASRCAQDGLTVMVPTGAQQVLMFLAPETGGDFKTLVGAVRGRPGIFVRASQDLIQAALDRSRLERYLAGIRSLDAGDPSKIKAAAPLMARSLAIKVDDKCLDRLPELQAPCLMQGRESLILNDGHSTSIVEALTSGPGSDLAMEASYTPQLNYGLYSPYIASVIDIARILDPFRVAQYQYIPALASQYGSRLALTLNTAPSFQNPKSVLVAALPAVEETQLPPLRAVDPRQIYCARRTALVLPVEGAPLVFSAEYAHDMILRLPATDGRSIDLPATADALRGGYVVDNSELVTAPIADSVMGTLRGRWGFDPYVGPSFRLLNTKTAAWEIAKEDTASLIVGREDTVHFHADNAGCVEDIALQDPAGRESKTEWKAVKPDEVEIKLPLQGALPGPMTLLARLSGISEPQRISIQVFSEAGRFDDFALHVGDAQGILKGSRLDQVASLTIGSVVFLPGELTTTSGSDELSMTADDKSAVGALQAAHRAAAKITLRDGRVVSLAVSIKAPRPLVALIEKSVQSSPSRETSNIKLSDSEMPQDATLVFSVRAVSPPSFSSDAHIEIAVSSTSFSTDLAVKNGGVILENSHVAVVTFNPAKEFGSAAYGPLRFRVHDQAGTGDWQPLGYLVRLPALQNILCPSAVELACTLSGSNLFLIDSVSSDPRFLNPIQVPDGFLGSSMPVPHATSSSLYLKLRDDPHAINVSTLTAANTSDPTDDIARSSAGRSSAAKEDGTAEDPDPKPAAAGDATQNPVVNSDPVPQPALN